MRLPTSEDFETPNVQSLAFIASTKLCVILNRVSKIHLKRRPARAEEIANIETALRDWIHLLPEDLRLYDRNGSRNPYCHFTSEIMTQYFVTIIFGDILGHIGKATQWRGSIPSLVAASCAVALYDEISCRDEAIFLPWSTGCFCLVIALPLIYHVPRLLAKEATRKTEIRVLHSIMEDMRERYGDSKMVLRLMQKLEKSIERTTGQSGDYCISQGSYIRANDLFPFSITICDNMDLLELTAAPINEYIAENFGPILSEAVNEATFEFNLMDFFESDTLDMNSILIDDNK